MGANQQKQSTIPRSSLGTHTPQSDSGSQKATVTKAELAQALMAQFAAGPGVEKVADTATHDDDLGRLNGMISSPLINALGHSTNVLIIALYLNRKEALLTREDIRSAIKSHKQTMNQSEQGGQFADSRIRDGKSTVNFWVDHLVETNVLRKSGYPIKFELNLDHDFVVLCRRMYPFGSTNPDLLKTTPGVIS